MAEALVGGAFLSATLQVLFDRMASRDVLDFFQGRKLNDSLLKNLKIKLRAVNAVLDDAEEKQIANQAVKEWLDELKDAVFDAEDLLDEIATEALQRKLEAGSRTYKTQVRNFISTLNPFDEGISSKIKKIIKNIDDLSNQKELLGLKEGVGGKPSHVPTTSLVRESEVYGRDEDKKKITKLLLSDDARGDGICVITIVGMGGAGKTTLAQLLYNDKKVEEYFDLKAWVFVSKELDVFRVTKTFLNSVDSETCVIDDLNLLQVKLREKLMGKKFLLVLDDFWNENKNDWDNLRTPFRDGAKGSKIIVTMRNESVASIMRTVPIHYLKQLSNEACWSLFAKHAFENDENPNAHPNLEVIGKKIVKKCEGLPLAVKTLGGLLCSKLDVEEWNDVLKSNIWDLPNDKSNILPALLLSYHYLPSHLKRCFAYCSLFPKGNKFEKEKLVLLWVAEGFVQQPKSKKRMEEVGDEYFRELSSRSFFQQSSGDKSSFVMHDLINDLAQFVSGEFCYRLEGGESREISRKVRHLSYFREGYDCIEKFGPFYEIKCLRTFLPINPPPKYQSPQLTNKVLHDLLSTLSCLRVLSLSHYENITELPDSLGNLKQLRYLDLSQSAIKRLPEVICTLCNLQTLMLSDCDSLTELPANIGRLTNLRHLDISGTKKLTEMPIQMSGLKSLQTLNTFVVGKHNGSRVGVLGEFRHLQGRLSILKLQNAVNAMDALEANLKGKEYVEELLLQWGGDTDDSHNERDVLEKLQPSSNLKKLTIKNYGGTSFPNWLGDRSFANIKVMCLSNCKYCLSLPSLGELPSLEELSIKRINSVERVDPEFYGSGSSSFKPFHKLKTLTFDEMSEWEEWSCSGVEGEILFPSLEVLSIKYCPKLRGDLPNRLPSLKELWIINCEQLTASIPRDTSIRKLWLWGCQEVVLSSVVERGLASLESLDIWDVTFTTWSTLLHGLTSLKDLKIRYCKSLLSFPETGLPSMLQSLYIYQCDALESLPEGMIHSCPLLQSLSILHCPRLKSFPNGGLPTTLKTLEIFGCREFELLPPEETMHNYYYASLERLTVYESCDSLKSFPLGLFPKLNYLCVQDCRNLESLWIPEELLTSLNKLYIYSCPKLVSFPNLHSLQGLSITECPKLVSFPNLHSLQGLRIRECPKLVSFPNLHSLQDLSISNCPELESFPQGGLPSNLISLSVSNCNKLTARRMQWGLQTLASLTYFHIEECEEVESFPEERLLPSTLTSLKISKLQNLKYLDKRGLQHLTSLQQLCIFKCPKLQCLPDEGLPTSLSLLRILESPLPEQRCQSEKGEDWPKIAHIPRIVIDGKLIS